MRVSLFLFLCFLFKMTFAQEQIHINCKVSFANNEVVETYQILSAKAVQFSLDQTQQLISFSGFYWVGKKRYKLKEKKLDKTADISNVNNSITTYTFQFPKGKKPTDVEYTYKVVRNEVMYLSAFKFEPNKSYTLKVDIPSHYQLTYKAHGSIKSTLSTMESIQSYQFTKSIASPSNDHSILQLIIHPKDQSPKDYFANWYLNLLDHQMQLSQASKFAIDEIVHTGTNQASKAKLYFEFIRDRVYYYGHETGIKMIQPENVNKVLLNKYGDCKDIALLLHAGLQYLKYESSFGLLNLIENPTSDYYLSSFNHAICVLNYEDELLFLDATDKSSQFGSLNNLLVDKSILMLSQKETSTHLILPKK